MRRHLKHLPCLISGLGDVLFRCWFDLEVKCGPAKGCCILQGFASVELLSEVLGCMLSPLWWPAVTHFTRALWALFFFFWLNFGCSFYVMFWQNSSLIHLQVFLHEEWMWGGKEHFDTVLKVAVHVKYFLSRPACCSWARRSYKATYSHSELVSHLNSSYFLKHVLKKVCLQTGKLKVFV